MGREASTHPLFFLFFLHTHPFVPADGETVACDGLSIPYSLDQAITDYRVRVAACGGEEGSGGRGVFFFPLVITKFFFPLFAPCGPI